MQVKVRDNSYWVERYGKGKPIVFLHGFTASTRTWQSILAFFPEYECILIDLPGHGQTKASVHSMEECCADLKTLMAHLQLDQIDLVGYSMGGRTALSFACYYPEMIRTLSLESASPGLKEKQDRQERQEKDQQLADFILHHKIEDFVDKWENLPLFDSQKQLPIEKRLAIREERLTQDRKGLALSLEVMGTGVMSSWWNKLFDLTFPVLLIVGEWDYKFVTVNRKMNECLPNSKIVVIEEAGHAIHVEQSKKFGTIVEDFIMTQTSR
ncbi:2-succinyl-6-hydroxy-2,4-cyclohexadiene-1-carboxylate synthase [Gracilibacillus kekensis]|uniref:Putative 2-succinyl-6-hydroxy-2,4-cyclohexadiene-1-carboxylate synthase n=1 Tax=Gracilibacillus kekensis TaxID=1027249 RepID=A0A1M7ML20_9BACI|nr:2-succinyl-6-hydroxy-2,4-cyclohexadiene-1-carboxylate synthase [Gracilibacillus kekensis]SHM91629.1 2-succinyl-6-hydroxy-2,4-cyclohexadiene-1-carboxylate synthase [Gracilibacillus kekensis]